MQSLQTIIVCLALATSVLSQQGPQPSEDRMATRDANQDFRDLLNALPEESLHAALSDHLQPRFQDGVFEGDRKAVEAVHAADPPLATKLIIVAARHDLVRRQNGTAPPPPPPPPQPSTSSQPAVVIPIDVSTTNSAGRATTVRTSVLAPPPTSVVVPVTTTNSVGSAITTSRTVAGVIISTTNAAGSVIRTASPIPTAGEVSIATDSKGSTFATTFTPDGDVVSSIVLETTTLPNGQLVTLTSFAVANPTRAAQSGGASPSSGNGSPGLQSGAGSLELSRLSAALLGLAVAMAIFM